MKIEERKIGEIKPYDKNAKKHTKSQIDLVSRSITEFGWGQPIVVDKNGIIIVGHCRYEAAKSLNLPKVPCLTLDLTEEQVKAYRLADNKLNESDWDMKLVISELKELSTEMLDLTGFDADLIIEDDDKDDEVPEDAPSIVKKGDIWQLGKHRLMCGDATSPDDVLKLMEGVHADMVFTDPPYNVNIKGNGKRTSNKIMNDNMSDESFDKFLVEVFKRFAESSKAGAGWYVFHSSSTQDQFQQAIEKTPWKVKTQIIWNKPSAAMGWGDYRMKHEPFFYCGNEKTQFYGDRTGTSVWDFQKTDQQLLAWAKKQKKAEVEGKTTIWTMKRDNVNEYVHPTQKPVELIQHALFNSSKAGDIILDLFGGSGSTLIACDQLERRARLIELDPKFVDAIVNRWCLYKEVDEVIKNGKPITWEVKSKKKKKTPSITEPED